MTNGTISIAAASATLAAARGVTQRCVSLATGTLGPDLRVNYEFGLVLGVDEFRQEQLYFLEKDYQHNRGLHGFGTVYGLKVGTATPPGSQDDLQITIAPGMAIDQYGRAILVRNDQCARLGAWLARQEQENPGIIERQRGGLSGDLSVYVVLSYAECTDMLVPIPGQPCDSADDSTAPSRIRDSYRIELRWAPPAMPAWDAVRRFGELIALVRPVVGLPAEQSDELLLADLVRLLGDPEGYTTALATMLAGSPSDLPRELFRLPADSTGPALDRLYALWASEVRPGLDLPPDLSAPEPPAEAGVLLAKIDFQPELPFDPQQPSLSFPMLRDRTPEQPSTEGRPFLLHSQLVQELRVGGAATEKRTFATLAAIGGDTLRVWVHYGELLDQPAPDAFELTVDSGPVTIRAVMPVAPNVFDLAIEPAEIVDSPQGPPLPAGALVALRFLLDEVQAAGRPLIDAIDTLALDFLGRDALGITVYSVVSAAAADQLPVQEFADIQTVQADGTMRFRLWLHTPVPVVLPRAIRVQRGVGPNASQHNFAVLPTTAPGGAQFFWTLAPPPNLRLGPGDVLTFSFDTEQITTGENRRTLAEIIAEQQLLFLGADGVGGIRAFHIVSQPSEGLSAEQVEELIRRAIAGLPQAGPQRPVLPFVSISMPLDNQPVIELWFHPSEDPRKNEAEIDAKFADSRPFQLLAELDDLGDMPDLRDAMGIERRRPNVFWLFLDQAVWTEIARRSPYLRFVFDTGEIAVNLGGQQIALREYMAGLPFVFAGALGEEIVASFARLNERGG